MGADHQQQMSSSSRSSQQLDVRDLRLVRAIFSEKTTKAAAKVLGLTQSGVSHQLRNLEERLQLEVFERMGRSLVVTEAGSQILASGEEILRSVATLEAELRDRRGAVPTLRVATQCYTAYGWLPSATVEMKARGIAVNIRPLVPRAATIAEALIEGEVDLGLCFGPTRDERLCQRRLFDDELVLIAAADHPLGSRACVSGADLEEEDLLMLESARRNQGTVGRVLFPRGGGFRSVNHLPLTEAVVEMVKAGLGVSILPLWTVAGPVERGELSWARLTRKGLTRKWVGLYRRDTDKSQAARTLVSVLKERGAPVAARASSRSR